MQTKERNLFKKNTNSFLCPFIWFHSIIRLYIVKLDETSYDAIAKYVDSV